MDNYNTVTIRQLLIEAFSDEDFTIFCYDHYRPVYKKFSDGMSFPKKVHFLIDYCDRNNSFDQLILLVKDLNPAKYAKFGLDVTHWPPLKKLALALVTKLLEQLPYITNDSIEFIDIYAAQILDPNYGNITSMIEEGNTKIVEIKEKFSHPINDSEDKLLGELDEAITPIFTRLEQVSSKSEIFSKSLTDLQIKIDEKDLLQATFPSFLSEPNEKPDLNLLQLARNWIDDEEENKAIELLLMQLSHHPQLEKGHALLIEALFNLGNYQKAIEWIKDNPITLNSPDIRKYLILSHALLGQDKLAFDELDKFSKDFPGLEQVNQLKADLEGLRGLL
jgi:tetratricopeptide (TPR) repeat protein